MNEADEIRQALVPVLHWFQSDEHPERPTADIIRELVEELRRDRASIIQLRTELAYVLQDERCNRLTPRVVDVAYAAFRSAKGKNDEDGGPTDWFTDTRPMVMEAIARMRRDLLEVPA